MNEMSMPQGNSILASFVITHNIIEIQMNNRYYID